MQTGQYSGILKIAKVTTLYKGGPHYDMINYRPISVLSPFNKIFKVIIKIRMGFLEKCHVISPAQFGFRQNYSTTLAISHFYDQILKEKDIFLDIAKAFDTVDHDRLISKLEHYGIRGIANDLMKSYLANRKQCVVGNNYIHLHTYILMLECHKVVF